MLDKIEVVFVETPVIYDLTEFSILQIFLLYDHIVRTS